MHSLVMSVYSHDFLVMSLYIYNNDSVITVDLTCLAPGFSGNTYTCYNSQVSHVPH